MRPITHGLKDPNEGLKMYLAPVQETPAEFEERIRHLDFLAGRRKALLKARAEGGPAAEAELRARQAAESAGREMARTLKTIAEEVVTKAVADFRETMRRRYPAADL